ncbi:MAG: hypothetical protein K6B67_04705 [Lachnospiraceae bacterium]|nr:hypothetical protein [Lachnospiraceae bacterium]
MKKLVNDYLKIVFIVVISALVAMLLMALVYCIPRDLFRTHIQESEDLIYKLQDEEKLDRDRDTFVYDTKTNIITLEEVIAPREQSPLKDALLAPTSNFIRDFWGDWGASLQNDMRADKYEDDNKLTYPRYWHGFVLFLKPMFVFFNLTEIYYINAIVLCMLSFGCLWLIYKKCKNYMVPFLILLGLYNPVYVARSFQLTSVFVAMIVALLLILFYGNKKGQEDKFLYVFAIDGIILAFLDFLTYPLVAFAIPLCFALIFLEKSFIEDILVCIKYGISFLLGYAGMWVMKWVLASIFTSENVMLEGFESVLHRTGTGEAAKADAMFNVPISPIASLKANLSAFMTTPTKIITIIVIISMIIVMIRALTNKVMDRRLVGKLFVFTLIAWSPVVWLIVLYNHCSLHPHLEWREWIITLFTVIMMIEIISKEIKQKVGK